MKKCEPLQCQRFNRLFDQFYEQTLTDIFFLKCNYRRGLTCTMEITIE